MLILTFLVLKRTIQVKYLLNRNYVYVFMDYDSAVFWYFILLALFFNFFISMSGLPLWGYAVVMFEIVVVGYLVNRDLEQE